MVETVSVVIPTYFRNDQLRQCLESCFDQSFKPLEIIVVDDSGEAHAEPVTDAFDVTYIPLSENQGAHVARNIGIDESTGRYIQLLDDDDRLLDEKVNKQVQLLKTNDDVGVVYCGLVWENGPEVFPREDVRGDVLKDALKFQTSPAAMGTMLIERHVMERILPLRHRHGADDIGLKIDLARETRFDFIDEVLLFRGDSSESVGTSMAAVEGRKRIIETYEPLYDEFAPAVKRSALAETFLVEGQFRLRAHYWSPAAIAAFARACYYVPGFPAAYVGSLLVSLGGRPVHDAVRSMYSKLVLGEQRRGKIT